MRFSGFGGKLVVAGLALMVGTGVVAGSADARSRNSGSSSGVHVFRAAYGSGHGYSRSGFGHRSFAGYRSYGGSYGGGLQCVPFARANTGIELAGNAATWWNAAQGVYERGARPEVGSVLNFRANGRMHMGHVAVVSNVVNARTVEIDHANWSGRGSINRDISVVDVSPGNDWTAVRVALGHGADFGSVYPTYGFIYDRPDHGTMVANSGVAPTPVLNAAPADLRPTGTRMMMAAAAPQDAEEVAEADVGDDDAPRMRRIGHQVVRVHTRGVFHGHVATAGRGGVGHASGSHVAGSHASGSRVAGTGRAQAARPAQVVRIQGAGRAAPARHHGRT